jgi:hypothetical protein
VQLRRVFLLGTVALASLAALVAIVTVLNGSFGKTEGKIFATIAATFVAGSSVIAGVALIERGAARPLGWAGLLLATGGFLLWTEQIWAEHSSDSYWKLLGLVLTWSLALLVVTTARLMARSERVLRTIYPATAVAAVVAAVVMSVMILRDSGDGWQLFAVLLILAILGEILIPVLERMVGVEPGERAERVLGHVAGAAVVAVRGAAGPSVVEIDGRKHSLTRDEHIAVRPA